MGLSVAVGIGAELGPDEVRDVLRLGVIDPALESVGLPRHREPAAPRFTVDLDLGDDELLESVKAVAAHIWLTGHPPDPGAGHGALEEYESAARVQPASGDGALWLSTPERVQPGFDHLIHHELGDGLYLPQDFESVLLLPSVVDPLEHEPLGSSRRLVAECRRLIAALDLPPELDSDGEAIWAAWDDASRWGGFGREGFLIHRLAHAADRSALSGAALVFQ